jgi:hypothetical protein
MTDLNIESFKSISETARARMQKECDESKRDDLSPCIGFHLAGERTTENEPVVLSKPLD